MLVVCSCTRNHCGHSQYAGSSEKLQAFGEPEACRGELEEIQIMGLKRIEGGQPMVGMSAEWIWLGWLDMVYSFRLR